MIEIRHLTKRYQYIKVISDLNITFPNKGLIAIVGSSGCGKTTLLHIIGGLDKKYYGDIRIDGKPIRKTGLKKNVGFLFQNFHLIPWMNGKENIKLPLFYRFFKYPIYDKNLNIEKCYSQKTHELSFGQRQRLAFLRSMIYYPKILLCDEPTSSLDEINSQAIMKLLKEESKRRLVIYVSHNLNLVEEYSDEIYEMKDGQITNHRIINSIDEIDDVSYSRGVKPLAFVLSWLSMKENKYRMIQLIIAVVLSLNSILLALSLSDGFHNQLNFYIDSMIPDTSISFRLKNHSNINQCHFADEPFIKHLHLYPDEYELLGIGEVRNKYNMSYNISIFDDSGFVEENDILYGRVMNKHNEIVISKSAALHLKKDNDIKSLINKEVNIWFKYRNEVKGKKMVITGISNDISNDSLYYQNHFNIIKEIFNEKEIKSNYGLIYVDNVKSHLNYLQKNYKEYEFKEVGKSTRDKIDDFMFKAKIVIYIFTLFVIITSIFLISQSMFLEVIVKRKEIAIMKCFGASDRNIFLFIFYQVFIIYNIGSIIAVTVFSILGYLLNVLLSSQLLFNIDLISFDFNLMINVYLVGLLLMSVSIMIPSIYAIKMNISDSLKINS